jgi:lipase
VTQLTPQDPSALVAGAAARIPHPADVHRRSAVGPSHRQTTVAVRGGEMTVGLWGPQERSAPTILAVHGVSASHRCFGLLADALPGVRIIAPDLRGRGRSNDLPGPYGMSVHADDLAAVLAALEPGPVVVVGHSMGAFVALVLAHRHPELVRAAVLVDGGIPLRVPAGLRPDEVVQTVLGAVAERLEMRFACVDDYRGYWQQHPAFEGAWTAGGAGVALLEDYIAYDLTKGDDGLQPATRYAAIEQDTADLHAGETLLAALDGLSVPAHLLWTRLGLQGEEPGLFGPEYIAEWQSRVPALEEHLSVREIPETNHYTIVMSSAGAAAVAACVSTALGRTGGSTADRSSRTDGSAADRPVSSASE